MEIFFSLIDAVMPEIEQFAPERVALLQKKLAAFSQTLNKEQKLSREQAGMISIDFALFKYGTGVAALANVDFDRTKAAADPFERNELRLMVRLLLARALLRSDIKRPEKR